MYKTPDIHRYLYGTLVPNIVKLNIIPIELLLENLTRIAHSLTKALKSEQFMNLFYDSPRHKNIFEVNTHLFENIYNHSHTKDKKSKFLKKLQDIIQDDIMLNQFLDITSPSLILKFPLEHLLKNDATTCFESFIGMLHALMPIII